MESINRLDSHQNLTEQSSKEIPGDTRIQYAPELVRLASPQSQHNVSTKTICLNMIVKNESHIIIKTLTNLVSKIKFDYWVIGDNGSTDNTKELIQEFFDEHKIPGELYEDEWVNFEHNRTKALERAYDKTDYVLIFDADDEIFGNLVIPDKILVYDSYKLNFRTGIQFMRVCFVNNRMKWKFRGVVHEYIESCEKKQITQCDIIGDYYIKGNTLGARSKNPNKYLNDAVILENAFYKALYDNDDISNRYVFYCANSYRDAGKTDKAIEMYEKTLEQSGWIQERYLACLNLYKLYAGKDSAGIHSVSTEQIPATDPNKNSTKIGIFYLVKAYSYDKNRIEAIYELVKYYCIDNMNEVAYAYYTLIEDYYEKCSLTDALTDKLFVSLLDYYFYFPYYMIIVFERLKKYSNGIRMYEIIFEKKIVAPQWWMTNLFFNLQFFIDKIDNIKNSDFYKNYKIYLNVLTENKIIIDSDVLDKYAEILKMPCGQIIPGSDQILSDSDEADVCTIPVKIINMERRADRKQYMISLMNNIGITNYEFIKAVDGTNLQPYLDSGNFLLDELKNLFKENKFNSREGIIGCALSHFHLWQQLISDEKNDYYVILEDDVTTCINFRTRLASLIELFKKKECIFLGYHMFKEEKERVKDIYEQYIRMNTSEISSELHSVESRQDLSDKHLPNPGVKQLNRKLYVGGTFGYSINKKGAQILVNYITMPGFFGNTETTNGIKHPIDVLLTMVNELPLYECQPSLLFSTWNENNIEIDSDIQNIYKKIDFEKYAEIGKMTIGPISAESAKMKF